MKKQNHSKPPFARKVLKALLALLVVVLIFVTGVLTYVNVKKNEISKNLISLVNDEIRGTISVESVSLGSLFNYPLITATLNNVQVHAAPTDSTAKEELIIAIPRIDVLADLNTILNNEVSLRKAHLIGGVLYINHHSDGKIGIREAFLLNKPLVVHDSTSFILSIDSIEISNLKVELGDDKLKKSLSVQIDSLHGNLDYRKSLVAGVAKAYGFVDEIPLSDSAAIPKMPLSLSAKYDVFLKERLVDVSSEKIDLGDFLLKTDIKYNYNKPYELSLNLETLPNGLNLESFFAASKDSASTKKERIYLSGDVHAQTTVSWKSNPDKNALNSIKATLTLEGKELGIIGVDLDGYLNKFERSQNFNLVDVGAVMFAGPVGLAITKGGDYTMLVLNSRGDSTLVNHFYAGWELKNGILTANDVALSTEKSRLSTSGWYNFNEDQLDFNIYIVDENGCALANQRFYGDSDKPKAGKVKLFKTVFGPVTNFFRNVGLANCETVYSGRVEAPSVLAKEAKKEEKEKRKEARKAAKK